MTTSAPPSSSLLMETDRVPPKAPILIVDDSPISRHALKLIVQKIQNVEVVEADCASSALIAADGHDFAAILLDIDMPDMSGLELSRLLRLNPATVHSPIMFITALAPTPEILDSVYANGGVDFITKPPRPAILGAKLRVFCDLYWQRCRLEKMNDDLETLSQAAHQASQAKSAFVANMSHEIRTPLNGILGTVELLQKTNLDRQQKRYTDIISSSGEALLGILNDILDLAKIEAGRTHVNMQEVALDDFLKSVIEPHTSRASINRIELIARFQKGVPSHIQTDPVLLKQILFNFLSNAVKFTARGHVILDVSCSAPTTLRFTVEDTGPGIPEDRLNQVFEAFTQVDPSTTRQFGGTGLGLAIAQNLASLLGGKIGVQSKMGQGSQFWAEFTVQIPVCLVPPIRPCPIDIISGIHDKVAEVAALNLSTLGHPIRYRAKGDPSVSDHIKAGIDTLLISQGILTCMVPDEIEKLSEAYKGKMIVLQALNDPPERLPPGPYRVLSGLHTRMDLLYLFAPDGHEGADQSAYKENADQAITPDSIIKNTDETDAFQGGRILLVEDDPVNRMIATEILEDLGYRPVIAENGLKAVERARDQKFDIILMDCMMPNMDGYQATSLIRTVENINQKTPIVAITASVMESDRQRCLQVGMNDFISKPFRSQDLKKKLDLFIRP
jgi:signal transduction histidine kinase